MTHRSGVNPTTANPTLTAVWREHHRYLLNVAYRMLGSVSEAEDVVQEAFTRLMRIDLDEIQDVRGWLVVAVTRLCLDHLRSARSRREVYVGPWLPEPVLQAPSAEPDPVDRVTLDDSVRMAMLLVLERLSPAERAAFVLHDVFQFSFEEVAKIVGRTPAACRQLASRARRRVRTDADPARFTVDPDEHSEAADRFIDAASRGDLDGLMRILDPNVVGRADSGGQVGTPREPIVGRQNVAQHLLGFLERAEVTMMPMPVNGEPGVLFLQDGRLMTVISLSLRDGLIDRIHVMVNPDKLAYAASVLDLPTFLPGETARQSPRSSRRSP